MPATAPPQVISSGMMKCSKSMNVATTMQRDEDREGKEAEPIRRHDARRGHSPPRGEKKQTGQQLDQEIAD